MSHRTTVIIIILLWVALITNIVFQLLRSVEEAAQPSARERMLHHRTNKNGSYVATNILGDIYIIAPMREGATH